jgi:FkbM family methyltransferase
VLPTRVASDAVQALVPRRPCARLLLSSVCLRRMCARCPSNGPAGLFLPRQTHEAAQVYCDVHFHFLYALADFLPVERDITMLDAGANAGFVTALFAELIQFRGHIVSVEANPGTIKILEQNVKHLGDRVTVVPAALTAHEAAERGDTLDFAGQTGEWWGFRVNRDARPAPGWEIHKVPSKSMQMVAVRAEHQGV